MRFNNSADAKKVFDGMQVEFKIPISDRDGNIIGEKTEKRFSYEAVIPTPKTREECPPAFVVESASDAHISEDYEKPWLNWYEWNYANWGVKWDASNVYYSEDGDTISFNSPWSKPDSSVFSAIAKKFNVEFLLAADNEDGGWEEVDYHFYTDGTYDTEESQWQIEENEERCREYEEEY